MNSAGYACFQIHKYRDVAGLERLRPRKRAVQEHQLNPLSMKILEGDFKAGDKIKVTADGDELKFQRK